MNARFLTPCLLIGLVPAIVWAHGMGAEWKQKGDQVYVEAFYDNGAPAMEARVQIVDAQKVVLVDGKTDAEGRCTLKAPNPGTYQLIVDAGGGHRTQEKIRIVSTLPANTDADPPSASGGIERSQAAQFPWERVAIGCAVIALVGGAWWWSKRTPSRKTV